MPSVYIETSIPSYYFETRRTHQIIAWREATRRWWDRYRAGFEVVTSATTLDEVLRAPMPKGQQCADLLTGVPLLPIDERVIECAEFFVAHRLLPRFAEADALHLAYCARHSIDYLLTWNIKHLANPNKEEHLRVLARRLGVRPPQLMTPVTLPPEGRV